MFNDNEIARMEEVELTSDVALSAIQGLSPKEQKALRQLYSRYDDEFPGADVFANRFRAVMDAISESLGATLRRTIYRRTVHFFTLFVYIYDRMYGLGSSLDHRAPRPLPRALSDRLLAVSTEIESGEVPPNVLDAVRRATADRGRRRTRLDYLASRADG